MSKAAEVMVLAKSRAGKYTNNHYDKTTAIELLTDEILNSLKVDAEEYRGFYQALDGVFFVCGDGSKVSVFPSVSYFGEVIGWTINELK